MTISDEEKRQIMSKLAQGKPGLVSEPAQRLDDQDFDVEYQNFDQFARRSSNEDQQISSKSSAINPLDPALLNQIKQQIKSELEEAKTAGQLRAGRIREIVQQAVSQVTSEFKAGSNDIRSIVKDAVATVNESLKEKGGEIKEEVTATIEGVIEGVNGWRRQAINKTQIEVKQLQNQLENQEDELQQEITRLISDLEEDVKDTPPKLKDSIEAAINALKNSEEVALLQKRYAQMQSQVAILRASLVARYGGRYEEAKGYLEEAKTWYNKTRSQSELEVETDQKRSQLEEKFGEAGAAIAKKERQIRNLLSDLLRVAAEVVREKEPPAK